MTRRRTISTIMTIAVGLGCLSGVACLTSTPAHTSAAAAPPCGLTFDPNNPTPCGDAVTGGKFTCGEASSGTTCSGDKAVTNGNGAQKFIANYAQPILNTGAGAVGIIVAIQYVIGGIQYSSSADDPSKVAAAKGRMINATLALLAFLFLYSFLQWITPGGFLNT